MGYPAGPSAPVPAQLTHQLAELILAESARAGLGPGSRLPTERQLAADLGATRTSIRHALADAGGPGAHLPRGRPGTFLRRPGPQAAGPGARSRPLRPGGALAGADDGGRARYRIRRARSAGRARPPASRPAGRRAGFAPADVMTIRRLLEPLAMPLVVAWATASDFREMDRCLSGGGRAASYEEFENWDLALHRSIMAASHSPLLGELYAVIETARHGQSWGDLKRRSASRERREQVSGRSHRTRRGAARPGQRPGHRGDAHPPVPGAQRPVRRDRLTPRPSRPGPSSGPRLCSRLAPGRARQRLVTLLRRADREKRSAAAEGSAAAGQLAPVTAAAGSCCSTCAPPGSANSDITIGRAPPRRCRLTCSTCHTPPTPLPLVWPGAMSPA